MRFSGGFRCEAPVPSSRWEDFATRDFSPRSLFTEARKEADRHKWIESQKHGRDLGVHALAEWFERHWPEYCRYRRLEHLEGARPWEEFSWEDFGDFIELMNSGDLLLDRILDRIRAGYENLDIIQWALDWGLSTERVINLLQRIDINRVRIDPNEAMQTCCHPIRD